MAQNIRGAGVVLNIGGAHLVRSPGTLTGSARIVEAPDVTLTEALQQFLAVTDDGFACVSETLETVDAVFDLIAQGVLPDQKTMESARGVMDDARVTLATASRLLRQMRDVAGMET